MSSIWKRSTKAVAKKNQLTSAMRQEGFCNGVLRPNLWGLYVMLHVPWPCSCLEASCAEVSRYQSHKHHQKAVQKVPKAVQNK